ncbi:MAG: UDP-N-acetylmuramate--L-alanine ligase [Ruminococcaceae bacterium]|nr:UDP-N-acetylmuramate--L-alanine ligase [Oscillospiraceae bacterium]
MNRNILSEVKRIHFIGIGGSGMCPIAEILHHNGYILSGSDMNESDTLERIKSYGIKVFMGHKGENIEGSELVVYTAACKMDNPEIVAAKEKGIPCIERSVMLGLLTDRYENAIAVSGTHGKTTTTAMITQILMTAGMDPSAVIGGKLPLIGGNGRVGKSRNMVCEACEYVDTFLQLHPAVSVILNLEADHLDYFGTLENIIKSFNKFAHQTSKVLVVNGDDKEAMEAVKDVKHAEIVTFGASESNDYYLADLNEEDTACEDFTVVYKGEKLIRINLIVPGEHNMLNALAAFATCHHLGADCEAIKKALESFGGVHRRFEVLGKFEGVTVADDFAHHPTELTTTLSAAMKMGYSKVWAVFQPHTFSRTYMFLDDFAKALSIPDRVVMTDILPVREVNTYGVKIEDLESKIEGACHFNSFREIADYVMANAKENDLILTLGGGDIYKCANLIVELYKERG